MKIRIPLLTTSVLSLLAFYSCDDDNDIVDPIMVEAPATYSFTRNNSSTVNFSGQTTRIEMSEATAQAFLNTSFTEAEIDGKFAHTQGSNDFDDPELNQSDKSVRSKVAASIDFFGSNSTASAAIKSDFDSFISRQVNEVFPAWNNTASKGVPGNLQQAGGGAVRYINGDGLEYNQAFAKSLIGGLMTDQMLNNYLSPLVLDEADNRLENDQKILAAGKNYTTMEHKWDEAYGYLYGAESTPATPVLNQDSFLNKYVASVEADADFTGIAANIYNAFKLGRAAIVAGDYELRDQQAQIIRENVSKVIGVRAVYYLQSGKAKLSSDKASAFHGLSEGYGFIYSLQFTREPNTNQPYFSRNEVQSMLDQLTAGDGFWDVSPATLDQLSDQISARFSFTTAQAAN
ncbi:DUF4856 domain-containing protein [Nonlabens marinus]|uniref:DUF4856 domain-containing protein n=1 Tax=Nonlabens marinus S1-08 TaxID=1454201 RepID=W8VRL5_9FLAO|nr:DUF4856 domain-containing protein [Nonlabens marinus]BAO55685.1 hypothetical protein NMS_1676 [Nonlabens marinus S1-08]